MREGFHPKTSSHRAGLILETLPHPRGGAVARRLAAAAAAASVAMHSEEHLDPSGGQRPEQEQVTAEVSLTTASGFQ